jgi:hypothetical protein
VFDKFSCISGRLNNSGNRRSFNPGCRGGLVARLPFDPSQEARGCFSSYCLNLFIEDWIFPLLSHK